MFPLFFFAFISGLITIAAPCIWPLLPIVLSASSTGGHRKPLGITMGIMITFGVLVLSISYLVKLIPFDTNILRFISVVVIAFLGFSLLIPAISSRLEAWASRFSARLNVQGQTNNGLIAGLITGAALGIVWTPCAGPILATIAALSATQSVNSSLILLTIVYLIGVSIPLFLFSYFGRRFFMESKKLSPYLGRIQQIFGLVMIITALLIFTNIDKTLSAKLLNVFPSFSDIQTKFESSNLVTNGLNQIKNSPSNTLNNSDLFNTNTPAPEIIGIANWINSSPLTLKELKGKVVLVDFWTYTCINCIRTLPYTTGWYNKYKDQGFVVLGIHTPEFDFEKKTSNVESAIKQRNILYPVAQDNDYATWNNYSNQYWPAEYLIDANGNVRRVHFGEGDYDRTEEAIKILLREAGKKTDDSLIKAPDQTPRGQLSPESYLGSKRMQYYSPNGSLSNGTFSFTSSTPPINSFSFGGTWSVSDEYSKSISKSKLSYHFFADKVFLVMGPGQGASKVKVYLDGKLIDSSSAGSDVTNGEVLIDSQRLYNLVDLESGAQKHTLELIFDNGISVFAFTFG